MKSVDAIVEKTLDRAEGNAVFIAIWILLVVGACLAAMAIHDFELRNQEQLESAHTAGMAIGSTMCGRDSK